MSAEPLLWEEYLSTDPKDELISKLEAALKAVHFRLAVQSVNHRDWSPETLWAVKQGQEALKAAEER